MCACAGRPSKEYVTNVRLEDGGAVRLRLGSLLGHGSSTAVFAVDDSELAPDPGALVARLALSTLCFDVTNTEKAAAAQLASRCGVHEAAPGCEHLVSCTRPFVVAVSPHASQRLPYAYRSSREQFAVAELAERAASDVPGYVRRAAELHGGVHVHRSVARAVVARLLRSFLCLYRLGWFMADAKPSNVVVFGGGAGATCAFCDVDDSVRVRDGHVTAVGLRGNRAHWSPELVAASAGRGDAAAAGASECVAFQAATVAWACLCGEHPFGCEFPDPVPEWVSKGLEPREHALGVGGVVGRLLGGDVEGVLLRMMHPRVEERLGVEKGVARVCAALGGSERRKASG